MPYLDWQYAPLQVVAIKFLKPEWNDNKKAVKIKIASGDEGMRRLLAYCEYSI